MSADCAEAVEMAAKRSVRDTRQKRELNKLDPPQEFDKPTYHSASLAHIERMNSRHIPALGAAAMSQLLSRRVATKPTVWSVSVDAVLVTLLLGGRRLEALQFWKRAL